MSVESKPSCFPARPTTRAPEARRSAAVPAECRRDPGRWWPCNPSSRTAVSGQTPTGLLSPKPLSWPWCRSRPSSTCRGCPWPPRFCVVRSLGFLCEAKRPGDGRARRQLCGGPEPRAPGERVSKGGVRKEKQDCRAMSRKACRASRRSVTFARAQRKSQAAAQADLHGSCPASVQSGGSPRELSA